MMTIKVNALLKPFKSAAEALPYLFLFLFSSLVLSCSDDPQIDGDGADAGGDDARRDVTADDVADEEAAEEDIVESDLVDVVEVVEDVVEDTPIVLPDVPDDLGEGYFPDDPSGPCIDDGDGARGRITFPDGTALAGATVGILVDGEKRLGELDDEGTFFVLSPCEEVVVEISIFESVNYPAHPSLFNLPIGRFDAAAEEPTFVVPLVTVEGVILDVNTEPIPEARLNAELDDSPVRVYNEQIAGEGGEFAVRLVPWPHGPYDLTALGPEDSSKNFRSATLSVLIGDPPPDPTTFTLFEDRCPAIGPVRTSRGTELEWLYFRISGDPYPDDWRYLSFDPGFFYASGEPDLITEELPLFCGVQTVKFYNAVWVDPDWPCRDWDDNDQPCVNNYPILHDHDLTEPIEEGLTVPTVRVRGQVLHTDDPDNPDAEPVPQEDVIVRYEARHRWGPGLGDTVDVSNEAVTDESGNYWMDVLPFEDGVEYTVSARIRDTDIRALGSVETTVVIGEEEVDFDVNMPVGPPRCILTGTVRSSEGRDFNEVQLDWWGWDDEGDYMYTDRPASYFSPEPTRYYRGGFPEEEIGFVPLLCGDHNLRLHSAPFDGCGASPEEVCFQYFQWWGWGGYDEAGSVSLQTPTEDVDVPVVHLSGFVRGPEGEPIEGVGVSAMYMVSPFSFAMNSTGTDSSGFYDFVVLPGVPWTVSISIADDYPLLDDYWPPEPAEIVPGDEGAGLNIDVLEGPPRCRFSGPLTTSEGVELDRLELGFFGQWYGLMGWIFKSDEPGVYYRDGNDALLMEQIPLVCGEQSFGLWSRRTAYAPSCSNPERFDQPCLNGYPIWSNQDIQDDMVGGSVPVVWLSGTVTTDGEEPIQGATIEASGAVEVAGDGEDDPNVGMGSAANFATTRSDGSYRMAVVPSLAEYTITITTPLDVDLGEIIATEVIDEDTQVDANFSLTD